ncbi:MAG TPA: NAD(P)/FAD-dependent oxidoreductase [Gammaproteobacteria bacterium]|nr:NAD(P)/FAD-dependent oxidoreductase [Gammaproteobacteria bacterium]
MSAAATPMRRAAIIGGGLAGSLLAILLARRGVDSVVIERATEAESRTPAGGRSINLALAARGLAALARAGVAAEVEPLLLPMRGRQVHQDGGERFLPYGQRRGEEIYSVARATLNGLLQDLARARFGVEYRYGQACVGVDIESARPIVAAPEGRYLLDADVVFATDGAGSAVRRGIAAAGHMQAREELLDHGYVELTVRPAADGGFALRPDALHIWPRGGFMLIALPNLDRSFTATLFLPLEGAKSFAALRGAKGKAAGAAHPSGAAAFFAEEFGDVAALIPNLAAELASRPVGTLGTVRCRPWRFKDRILLLGDAAHAIVPFHGQGMNAAFEDCAALDELVGRHGADWPRVLEALERGRLENADAIAEMALENYREMRDTVRSPNFELRRAIAFELERRFPERFVPRYSMVMFHPEISYAEAQRRGAIQADILAELAAAATSLEDVDFDRARELVETRLNTPR